MAYLGTMKRLLSLAIVIGILSYILTVRKSREANLSAVRGPGTLNSSRIRGRLLILRLKHCLAETHLLYISSSCFFLSISLLKSFISFIYHSPALLA